MACALALSLESVAGEIQRRDCPKQRAVQGPLQVDLDPIQEVIGLGIGAPGCG